MAQFVVGYWSPISLKLFYCPSCTRVYCLPEDSSYICGRVHVPSVWTDGKRRRFVLSERTESNRPPWPIPPMAEEREVLEQELTESWLDACKNPDDTDYGDYRKHFGYGAFGGRHLARDQVVSKYAEYVLRLVG